jgi:Uma2 family endonuclease
MNDIVIEERVRIPEWVQDFESFRRWARSDEFPERGRFSHLAGQLWVDLGLERFAHNQLKGVIAIVVGGLVVQQGRGHFFQDGMRLTHVGAELSTEPDGMFVSHEALDSGRVLLEEGDDALEVMGTPDMVLEVISPTSVEKDTVVLRKLYWEAGVTEYWLVDSREKTRTFDVLRYGKKGYVAGRKQSGWVNSPIFGKAFRLSEEADQHDLTEFHLEIR